MRLATCSSGYPAVAEIEDITARSSFRFDATRAYYDLVQPAHPTPAEERIEGLQTIGEFLDLRLAPAMATCAATAARIETWHAGWRAPATC